MKKGFIICVVLALALITACSKATNEAAESEGTKTPASSAPAETQAAVDPNVKYDPPVTVTTVRAINAASMTFHEGESIDKNAVYDAYLRDDGIIIKNDWAVDVQAYNEKLNVSIASNTLPDFFLVSAAQLPQLLENDMIMDITEVYNQYASEATKKVLTGDGGIQMKSATVDGKLMAIPVTNSPFNSAQYVWLRKDWLDEMNLPEPKTTQDLLQIAEAFSTRDSGGKGDVYGMTLNQNIMWNTGFYNQYHAYPWSWVKDDSGNLAYGSIQPAMKTALKQLQDMYKAGQIDPEFAVNDDNKAMEFVANNRLGMLFNQFWYSAILQGTVVKDNKVTQEWKAYMLPSIDDQPAKTQVSASVGAYYVINKNAKNPEAVIKLLNRWCDLLTGGVLKEGEPRSEYNWGKERKQTGKAFYGINPVVVYLTDVNLQGGQYIPEALKTGDTSKIDWSADLLDRYKANKDYQAGNLAKWFESLISGEGGTFQGMYEYYKQNRYQYDEFYGAPTPTMTEKMELLNSKEKEVFTKIVMGNSSIDEFDNFVEEWKKLGGEQITQEVNDWYKEHQ